MKNENVNLNDIGASLPRRSANVFDLTSGTGLKAENVENAEMPSNTRKVVPIQTGHVDMGNMKSVDINSILPKREAKPSEMETTLYADLDAAVDRELASITERHEALFEAQQQELEEAEYKKEEEELQAQDDFALNGTTSYNDNDDTEGLYDDDDEDDIIPINHGNTNPSKIVNAADVFAVPTDRRDDGRADKIIVNDNPALIKKEEVASDKDIEETTPEITSNITILDGINNEDLFDEEDEEDNNSNPNDGPSSQEILDDLKTQIKEKVSPIRNIDLSKFTFAKKAVSAQKVMKLAIQNHQNAADWVLPNAGRSISMTGLSGPEILKLNPENSNRNRANTFRDMYRIIYDHVLDGNKPDFEVWLKQLRYVDLQHVYFALYMATFGGSNFINYSCPKCNKVFIKDIDFKDMIVYADDETKAKIQAMLKMDTTSAHNDEYPVTLIPVSDSYAFAIKTPSVWNVIMETASLSDKFLEKHADLIDVVSYIDGAYLIDSANEQLIPINTKPYH